MTPATKKLLAHHHYIRQHNSQVKSSQVAFNKIMAIAPSYKRNKKYSAIKCKSQEHSEII